MYFIKQISLRKLIIFVQQTFTIASLVVNLLSQQALAQLQDDFSDGDFSSNPIWSGTDTKFLVTTNQLKLQAPAQNDNAFLSSSSVAINNATWEFYVKFDFNPSSTNYARVYLVSDQQDISGALNGYFVLIGNTPDEISLYEQSQATKTRIIDGADGRVNLSTVSVKVKVTRDAEGNWELFSDVGVTGNYILEGIAYDTTHLSSTYFGVYCAYTSTRSDKFHFDDFTITGNPFADVIAPEWQSLAVLSSSELELVFDEPLERASAENVLNYTAQNVHPASATLQDDERIVKLMYSKSFANGVEASLTVSNVKDISGNVVTTSTKSFLYFQAVPTQYKDIVINEIFPDPTPSVGLPEAEFVELYNRSTNPVDLVNWKFTDGKSEANLPARILLPGQYCILTATSSAPLFTLAFPVGVSNFPTLNNSGDALVLKDSTGVVIDSINYVSTWYNDEDVQEGGWTLELIDPENLCAESSNWSASEDATGGTPGKQNSIFANKPDATGPIITAIIPIDATTLLLYFNEKLEKTLPSVNSFNIQPLCYVNAVEFVDSSLKTLRVTLSDPLEGGTLYTIVVQNIYDCAQNSIHSEHNTVTIALPEQADSLDIVINEILFNPRPTGVDFVEVYNKSDKYIALKSLKLGNVKDEIIINAKSVTETDILFKPKSYLVFTTDVNTIKSEYSMSHEEAFVQSTLPSMNDDAGHIILMNDIEEMIDQVQYNEAMHSIFLKDDEGVSLERISVAAPSDAVENWRSASSTVGFATPGYTNSNARPEAAFNEEDVNVEPEIFQPLSGQIDFTQINYHFNQGGLVANVNIFDHQGRKIKELANNEILSTEGFFRWDGDQDNGTKVRVGYYMVRFEIFDTTGMVKTFKKRIAIAGRF